MRHSLLPLCATLATISTCVFAPAQVSPKGVHLSYRNEGASTQKVLSDLSEKYGVKLLSSVQFQELPLVINVKDVSLQDLMNRIGKVTHAKWEEKDSGWWLVRSPELEKSEAESSMNRRISGFTKELNQRKSEVAKLPPFNQTTSDLIARQILSSLNSNDILTRRQLTTLENKLPANKFARSVIALIHPEDYASIQQKQRIVFSLRPNKLQKMLPKEAESLLATFFAEQKLWLNSLRDLPIPKPTAENAEFLNWDAYRAVTNRIDVEKEHSKLLVSASMRGPGSGLTIEVMLSDDKGSTEQLALDYLAGTTENTRTPNFDAKKDEKPFIFEPVELEFAERLREAYLTVEDGWHLPSQELLDGLSHPEAIDPVSLGLGNLLIQAANSEKLQLVACVPDEMLPLTSFVVWKKQTPSQALSRILWGQDDEMKKEAASGWLTITWPASEVESKPISRKSLGEVVRQVLTDEMVTLDTKAKIALLTNSEISDFDDIAMCLCRSRQETVLRMNELSLSLLRFHDSLTQGQRNALTRGETLTVSALSTFQRSLISSVLYDERNVQATHPNPMPQTDDQISFYGRSEPTEILPAGLPSGARVRCNVQAQSCLLVNRTNGGSYAYIERYKIKDLARYLYDKANHPERVQGFQLTGFQLASNTAYEYIVDYNGQFSFRCEFNDSHPQGQVFKQIDDLPASIREEIDKELAEIKKEDLTERGQRKRYILY